MKRNIKSMLAFLFLVAASTPLSAETLTCIPSQKFFCSSKGCKAVPAKVRAVIEMDKRAYSRCDRNGCDKYDATMSIGSIYLDVLVPGKSVTTKVEITSVQYFETVNAGLGGVHQFWQVHSQMTWPISSRNPAAALTMCLLDVISDKHNCANPLKIMVEPDGIEPTTS